MWQSLKKLRSGIGSTWDCPDNHDNSTTIDTTNLNALDEPRHKFPDGTINYEDEAFDKSHPVESYMREKGISKTLSPMVSKKLAFGAALIGSAILSPVKEMFHSVGSQLDVMEVACAPGSSLTSCFEDAGYFGMRINYKNGYDLDKKAGTAKFAEEVKEKEPRLTWVSLPCKAITASEPHSSD